MIPKFTSTLSPAVKAMLILSIDVTVFDAIVDIDVEADNDFDDDTNVSARNGINPNVDKKTKNWPLIQGWKQ